jgi:hypothetical protein
MQSNRTQAHRVADTRYGAKLSQKVIKFNTEKTDDLERIRKIQNIPDFANWVKSKIDELPA